MLSDYFNAVFNAVLMSRSKQGDWRKARKSVIAAIALYCPQNQTLVPPTS